MSERGATGRARVGGWVGDVKDVKLIPGKKEEAAF